MSILLPSFLISQLHDNVPPFRKYRTLTIYPSIIIRTCIAVAQNTCPSFVSSSVHFTTHVLMSKTPRTESNQTLAKVYSLRDQPNSLLLVLIHCPSILLTYSTPTFKYCLPCVCDGRFVCLSATHSHVRITTKRTVNEGIKDQFGGNGERGISN